jgi:hypothetical protein
LYLPEKREVLIGSPPASNKRRLRKALAISGVNSSLDTRLSLTAHCAGRTQVAYVFGEQYRPVINTRFLADHNDLVTRTDGVSLYPSCISQIHHHGLTLVVSDLHEAMGRVDTLIISNLDLTCIHDLTDDGASPLQLLLGGLLPLLTLALRTLLTLLALELLALILRALELLLALAALALRVLRNYR